MTEVQVCYQCRGAGIAPVPKEDKRDNPPIKLCHICRGSGTLQPLPFYA